MRLGNIAERYGLISLLLHWTVALSTIGLFALGLWMVGLGYYDPWYYKAPWWHKGIGAVVFALVFIRWLVLLLSPVKALTQLPRWQHLIARLVHQSMNLLILFLGLSGYLIVTAQGQALVIFDRLRLPSIMNLPPDTADFIGQLHLWAAWLLIGLASVHALAALKHHFINKDATLKRMLPF